MLKCCQQSAHTGGGGLIIHTDTHVHTGKEQTCVPTLLRSEPKQTGLSFSSRWMDGWVGGGQACLQHFLVTLTPE